MAFVAQDLPENEQNKIGQQGTTTPNPLSNIPPPTTQTGGSSGAAQSGTANPNVGTPTQFGSSASKLSDYLNTNKPQIEAQGQKIAGDLTAGYNQTYGDVGSALQGFGSQVQGGYAAPNQDLVNQAASNPTQFSSNPDNVKEFQAQYNNQYTGPQNFESTQPYNNVQNEVSQAVQNASLLNNPTGLGQYLNKTTSGNYTPGMNSLDTALLTGNPQSLTSIQQAAKPFAGLTNYLGSGTQNADQSAQAAQQAADQSRQAAQSKFTGAGGVIPTFENQLSQAQTDKISQSKQGMDAALKAFQTGTATPAQLSFLGLTPGEAASNPWGTANELNQLYGVQTNWNNILNPQSPDVVYGSPGSVASADDIAKAQALSQLTGQNVSGFLGATGPNGSLFSPNQQALDELQPTLQRNDIDFVNSTKLPGMANLTTNQFGQQPRPQDLQTASQAAGAMNRLALSSPQALQQISPDKQNWLQAYNAAFPTQYIQMPDGSSQLMKWNGTVMQPYTDTSGGTGGGVSTGMGAAGLF